MLIGEISSLTEILVVRVIALWNALLPVGDQFNLNSLIFSSKMPLCSLPIYDNKLRSRIQFWVQLACIHEPRILTNG